MGFCPFRFKEGPSGPYGIQFPPKAREAFAARNLTLFLEHRLNWVEDSVRVVVRVMLTGEGNVSDYLRLAYPETFTERQRKTETDELRRTLLFRLRYLFRCLVLVADYYTEFRPELFTGLRVSLDIFAECVRQAVGEEHGARLKASIERFGRLWQAVNFNLTDAEAIRRELQIMLDEIDAIFESLREVFLERESSFARKREAEEKTASELAALRVATEERNRLAKQEIRVSRELTATRLKGEADDPYSSLAGLERATDAERRELQACFRYSHEKYAIDHDAKKGGHTLRQLAEIVWRDNREEFARLAKLASEPGYRNARSLASKLYKLAKKYPQADHFRWRN